MKKFITVMLVLAFALCIAGCGNTVSVGAFSSKYFNNEDYDAAVNTVLEYFKGFEGCTMKKIGYAGDKAVKAEADSRGLAPEQVIVLTSTFTTDGENHENGLEPKHTYEDYRWILTRASSFELWEHQDHGYG